MTLKRLMIVLAVLVVLAGVGIMWLWQYAYTPEGRARVIIAQLKRDDSSLRGWMLQHHVVRPGYLMPSESGHPLSCWVDFESVIAAQEMAKIGPEILPLVIDTLKKEPDSKVRWMAVQVCGALHNPVAIKPLIDYGHDRYRNPYNGTTMDLWANSMAAMGPEAIDPLIRLLEDSDNLNRYCAATALGKLKDKRATAALIRHSNDPDTDVRKAVTTALEKLRAKPPPASQPGKP
jgi:hypothetical protein